MAIGSGLGSQVGYSVESVYGTFVAPAKFLRARSYEAKRVAQRVQGDGIQAGSLGDLGAFYVETTQAGTGTMAFDVQTVLQGPLLQTLMGTSVTPAVVVTGSAWGQTHTLADTYGKSLTFQVGAPYRGGATVRPHTLTGVKVTGAEFSCDVAGLLQSTFTFDAKTWTDTQSLASASYVASRVFAGGGNGTTTRMSVKMGTFGSEAAVAGVKSVSCKIDRPLQVDDYTSSLAGLKNEPVLNGPSQVAGSITCDWLDTAVFQDIANSNASTNLVLEWVDTVALSGSTFPTFRINVPGVFITQDTQAVAGREVLSNQWNFTWKDDGTHLPSIYVISSEATL